MSRPAPITGLRRSSAAVRPLLLALAALIPAASVQAGKVYKWIDEDGSVHYEDRQRVPFAEEMQVKVPTAGAAPEGKEPASAPGEQAPAEDRQAACDKARATLDSYVKAPFLYEEVDGKRHILSDAERNRIQDQARAAVKKACSPPAP
jgi:hypothetical protein